VKKRTNVVKKKTEGESWKLNEETKKICEELKSREDKTKKSFDCRTKQIPSEEMEDQLAQVRVVLHRIKMIEQAFTETSR
jgi:cellobiose phosphorylase